jgi:tetratricopeptide (TPR) repeat protein
VRRRSQGVDAALLRALLAVELLPGDLVESRAHADEAIRLARATGDPGTFARVVRVVEGALREPASLDRRLRLVEEAEVAALHAADPAQLPRIATAGQMCALESGNRAEYERYFRIATTYAEQSPEPYTRYSVAFLRSLWHLLAGDISEAEATCDIALELGTASAQPEAFSFYAGQLFEIRRAQGRLPEILPAFERTASENPGLPVLRAALGMALCEVGRFEDARQLAHADFEIAFAAFRRDNTWTTSMLCWAEVCRALDESEPASILVEALTPWRDQVATTGITCAGSLAYGLALALATTGRINEAADAFDQALDVNERLGAPILVARTEAAFAWALRETDPERARALAGKAAATADRLGLGTIGKRAVELLDALA